MESLPPHSHRGPRLLSTPCAAICAALLFCCFCRAQAPQEPQAPPQAAPLTVESEQLLGAFPLGSSVYTVISREKRLIATAGAAPASTVTELRIEDANGTIVHEETFPDAIVNGQFAETISASASIFSGNGGAALVLRFLKEPAPAAESEWWELFVQRNGTLTPLGLPLPLGHSSATAGGVLTAVMVVGGVDIAPLISTAEYIRFRAWTGHFFMDVPVRVNWPEGQWSEAEQCFALDAGSLQRRGCNMLISLAPQPPAEGAVITLYAQPAENVYNSRPALITPGMQIEYLLAQAVVNWEQQGEHIAPRFQDLWLQIRIGGAEGWVHSEADLAAIGLPATKPPR